MRSVRCIVTCTVALALLTPWPLRASAEPPIAVDDVATTVEGEALVIDVLANDSAVDPPATLLEAGQGGYSSSESVSSLSPTGDVLTWPDGSTRNGRVSVDQGRVLYEPKAYVTGTDFFSYAIADADGDTATATVTITVTSVNNPPEGPLERSFSMTQGEELAVPATSGLLAGVYDPDNARVVADGSTVTTQALSVQILSPPEEGELVSFEPATGAFRYQPPSAFSGEVTFTYQIFDGGALSADVATARITVVASSVAPPPPEPGRVVANFNLSNQPLEQTVGVPANVLVVMDDSGSMDWHSIIQGEPDGIMTLSNAAITTRVVQTSPYAYLYALPNATFPSSTLYGRVLPTEAALLARSNTRANQWGVWRARSALFNRIYYNPTVSYQPWRGFDLNGVAYGNANPSAVRLDPRATSPNLNLLATQTYVAAGVPRWTTLGGTETNFSFSLYIPHYYETSAPVPLAWNAPKTLIEIRGGSGPLTGGFYPGGPERQDCAGDGDPNTCTYAEEIQNFANWFQYYRSRELVSKANLGRVVADLQDIRVGYDTINQTTSVPIRDMNERLAEGNKKALIDNIYAVDSFGESPLRQALDRAGKTFACETGNYCPRAEPPAGFCQQNFALLYTDGYWNGGAGVSSNQDADSAANRFDGGRYADAIAQTLADTAMYHYKRDFHPTYTNLVPISRLDQVGAAPGAFASGQSTMHQHMKTYTLAFGVRGTIDPASVPADPVVPFAWTDPFNAPAHKIDDLLHAALNGRGEYLNASNPQELQVALERAFLAFTQAGSSTSSAAFNSTSLEEGTLLYRGFYDLRYNTGELSATAVARDGSLAATPLWRASQQMDAKAIDQRVMVTWDRGATRGIPFRYSALNAAQKSLLSDAETRFLRGDRTVEQPTGALRKREAVGGLLGDIVNSSPVFVGAPRGINRDQSPYPVSNLYSTFAAREANRTPVVYVGANDGSLHGFHARTGVELMAYVPNKLIDATLSSRNALDQFASPFYQHRYFVDLTPRLNDVYLRSSAAAGRSWRTVLVGGLGGGGKGFYALDVTDPERYTDETRASDTVLWEFTDEDDTYPLTAAGQPLGGSDGAVRDSSNRPVKDLGYALSLPVIGMSNATDGDNEKAWIAIFGNGQNSTAGIAKLFALFIERGQDGWQSGDVVKLDTGFGVPVTGGLAGFPNGLGSPTAVDVNLDGTVDRVYAGDRLGNVFRFDLSASNPGAWSVTRLFTAVYTRNGQQTVQPVLSQPLVIPHPTQSGFLVIFGTGSYATREDARNTDIQSIYGIWDRDETLPATANGSRELRLVEQTLVNVLDTGTTPQETKRVFRNTDAVEYRPDRRDCSSGTCLTEPGTYGWYVDLDLPAASLTSGGQAIAGVSTAPQYPGERAIRRIIERNGALVTTTVLPALDEFSCYGTRPGAVLVLSALTGGDAGQPLIDFNNDGRVDEGDLIAVDDELRSPGLLMNQTELDGQLVDLATLSGEGSTDFLFVSGGNDTIAYLIDSTRDRRTGRLSWRELDFAE